MAASDEIIVIHRQNWVGRVEEFRMEDNLDTVGRVVEELHSANLVKDGVFMIIDHVVGNNWGKAESFHCEEASTQQNSVLAGNQLLLIRHWVTLVPLQRSLEDATANALFNDTGSISERFDDGLAFQSLDSKRGGLSRHNDESNNGHVASDGLETMIETSERLDEHVYTLVPEFVPTSGEDIKCVVRLEIVMAIEMTTHKVVDLFLVDLVKILELVDSGKLGHIKTIGKHAIRLALQKMLRLESSNVRNCGENITSMSSRPFNAVSVVNSSLASFSVDIEPLQVIVKVDRTSTEVSTEKSGVCGEDGCNVNVSLFAKRQTDTGKPFVEMSNDSLLLLVADKLFRLLVSGRSEVCLAGDFHTSPKNQATRYPKTIASLVSSSFGGEGIPAEFHKSVFHSSKKP